MAIFHSTAVLRRLPLPAACSMYGFRAGDASAKAPSAGMGRRWPVRLSRPLDTHSLAQRIGKISALSEVCRIATVGHTDARQPPSARDAKQSSPRKGEDRCSSACISSGIGDKWVAGMWPGQRSPPRPPVRRRQKYCSSYALSGTSVDGGARGACGGWPWAADGRRCR